MLILQFDSKEAGKTVLKAAWVAYIKDMFSQGKPIRNGGEDVLATLDGLSDDEIGRLRVCGHRDEQVEMEEGLSVYYTNLLKAHELDIWYCHGIPDDYLEGVGGYVKKELPPEWLSPMPGAG